MCEGAAGTTCLLERKTETCGFNVEQGPPCSLETLKTHLWMESSTAHTHMHTHSCCQISQVCAEVWLQLLPARGWEIEPKACRFGNDFNMVPLTVCVSIRLELNISAYLFVQSEQICVYEALIALMRWSLGVVSKCFLMYVLFVLWGNSWLRVRDLLQMLISSPWRDTAAFPQQIKASDLR